LPDTVTVKEAAQLEPGDPQLVKEYVASGTLGAYFNIVRALPPYIDDLSLELGNDIYERMHRDPVLQGVVNVLKTLVLHEGINIIPSHDAPQKQTTAPKKAKKKGLFGGKSKPAEDQPEESEKPSGDDRKYKKSVEISDFVRQQIDLLNVGIDTTLEEMMDSIVFGNRVAELVWIVKQNKYWLDAIKPKHRRTTAFVCDPYNNVLGLIAAIPGAVGPRYTALFIDNQNINQLKVIPRDKFFVSTFRMRAGDPRGNSVYRPAYAGWWHKQADLPEYAKYKGRFGGTLLWGTTAPNTSARPMRETDGTIKRDGQGRVVNQTPQEEMADTLSKADGSRAFAFPHQATVNQLTPVGEGKVFTTSIDMFNREMTMAVLGVIRATMESQYGSKADSKTSQDLLGSLIAWLKGWLGQAFRRDVLYKIVLYNFGQKIADEFTPRTSLTLTEPKDKANMIRALSAAGWRICMNQWPEASKLVGLIPPDLDTGYLEVDQAKQQAESQAEMMEQQGDAEEGKPKKPNEDDDADE
jgi:hypothetical protein